MDSKCVAANNQKFNLRGVECCKQISEVGVHAHWDESR